MEITRQYATANYHYKNNIEISVKTLVLHSVGCSQPDPAVFVRNWNNSAAMYPAHMVIGADRAYEVIPCLQKKGKAVKCYHVGSANAYSIGVEMTEPSSIEYTGGASFKDKDPAKTKAHVKATYANAVKVFAHLCTFHGLDPLADGVILSHSECHKRGIGTNHADVEHLWKHYGLTMDGFRKAVKAAMSGESSGNVAASDNANSALYRVQVGAYGVRKNADAQLAKVKAAGFNNAFIAVVNGLYKIQVGAFSVKANAEAVLAKIEAAGFNGFITKNGSAAAKKSVEEIAREVIKGLWGSGAERKKKLIAAGYDYAEVQAMVNKLLKG